MKRNALAAVAALLVLIPWVGSVRADAPLYTVQNLGSFNGEAPSISGINASGQVVGNVSANGSMAVRYTDGAGWQSLPGLDSSFSVAIGINSAGDVVGYRVTPAGQLRAFRYRNGAVEDIAPLPGGSMTFGFAINDASEVTGYADTTGGVVVPFVAAGAIPTALPALSGSTMAYGCGINANSQVAGISVTPSGAQHGIRIDPSATSPLEIASLDGLPMSVTACAIDAAGHVGGQIQRTSGALHAFRYSDGAGVQDLDTFGSTVSNVESIAAGVSAGWYTLADGSNTHAFAHRDADGSFDLNTRIDAPGWVLARAKAINESGVIAGEGTFNDAPAVYRLTPQEAKDTTPPVIDSVTASPDNLWPPDGRLVSVTVTVSASDDVDAQPVCALASVTGFTSSTDDAAVTGPFSATLRAVGGRTYSLNVRCTDAAGNASDASAQVVVPPDTTAPEITSLSATPTSIWPANNHMVPVSVSVSATDDVDASPVCAMTSVTGGPASDIVLTGPFSANVRAVRNATYLFNVSCTDRAGNSSLGAVSVSVGKNTTLQVYHYNHRLRRFVKGLALAHGRARNHR